MNGKHLLAKACEIVSSSASEPKIIFRYVFDKAANDKEKAEYAKIALPKLTKIANQKNKDVNTTMKVWEIVALMLPYLNEADTATAAKTALSQLASIANQKGQDDNTTKKRVGEIIASISPYLLEGENYKALNDFLSNAAGTTKAAYANAALTHLTPIAKKQGEDDTKKKRVGEIIASISPYLLEGENYEALKKFLLSADATTKVAYANTDMRKLLTIFQNGNTKMQMKGLQIIALIFPYFNENSQFPYSAKVSYAKGALTYLKKITSEKGQDDTTKTNACEIIALFSPYLLEDDNYKALKDFFNAAGDIKAMYDNEAMGTALSELAKIANQKDPEMKAWHIIALIFPYSNEDGKINFKPKRALSQLTNIVMNGQNDNTKMEAWEIIALIFPYLKDDIIEKISLFQILELELEI